MDWISFRRCLSPSVDFKGSLDNSVRQLKLKKINLTLSGEMKGFYLLEPLCFKCGWELASTDRRKHIALQEERQAQPESYGLMCLLSSVQASISLHFYLPEADLSISLIQSGACDLANSIAVADRQLLTCSHEMDKECDVPARVYTLVYPLSVRLQTRIQLNYCCHKRKLFLRKLPFWSWKVRSALPPSQCCKFWWLVWVPTAL